jgi:hypothetical protein
MYEILIVTYNGNKGYYASFGEETFDSSEAALRWAKGLALQTGKCYGVFQKGKQTPAHETSFYYKTRNLKRGENNDA